MGREDERISLTIDLAAQVGETVNTLKMEDVIRKLDKEEAKAFSEVKKRLEAILGKVKALNEINNQLLNNSLNYIKSAFELVSGKSKVNRGYARSGNHDQSVKVSRNFLNTRV